MTNRFLPTGLLILTSFLISISGFSPYRSGGRLQNSPAYSGPSSSSTEYVVVRVYFSDPDSLATLAAQLDIWEVHHDAGFLIAMTTQKGLAALQDQGFQVEIDAALSEQVNLPPRAQNLQGNGIPGFPCYRTVEETYATLQALASEYPTLTQWIDIGDSWEKDQPGGEPGYDLRVFNITNQDISGPKPTLFLMAAIHAREYVTAETATRFAEHLLKEYGHDADITWILDYYSIQILPFANPDGRKLAEIGSLWRKNTDNDDRCNEPAMWGTDLNRNSNFLWGGAGASTDPCNEVYRGPAAASEPETMAFEVYLRQIYPGGQAPTEEEPSPGNTPGIFLSLHSYGNLVLWPWGWTSNLAPNAAQLQTLGRKLAYYNHYQPEQASALYPTSGSSDDWAYGELGIAAYTFEMGDTFFQDCASFEQKIYPENLQALVYAARSTRRPYTSPSGPDTIEVKLSSPVVVSGFPITLTARAEDTRFPANSGEHSQPIQAARFSLDAPSWITSTQILPLSPQDGSFDTAVEDLAARLDTSSLAPGRHIVFLESQDAEGVWGSPAAAFLWIEDLPRYAGTFQPAEATETIEPGQTAGYPVELGNTGNISDSYSLQAQGNQWPVSFPKVVGPLLPSAHQTITITAAAPLTVTAGMSDTLVLEATSQGDPLQTFTTTLTTRTQPAFDLRLSADNTESVAFPGEEAIHLLELRNTGTLTDTYHISTSGSAWPTSLPNEARLSPGESYPFQVKVEVPPGIAGGRVTSMIVKVQSEGDPSREASLTLTTRAGWRVFLLNISR